MSDIITNIAILIGGTGAIFFAVSYMTFFNWRKTEAGRSLMGFVSALVALFILGVISLIFGEYELKHDLRLLTYTAVAFSMWRLVWVLWRNWRGRTGSSIEPKGDDLRDQPSHLDR